MINYIYTYDMYILQRSIYQIHNLLFYSGHSFYINSHMGKLWTDSVAIFKLLCVFSWSPSNQKLFTPSKVNTSKNAILKYFLFMVKNWIKGPCSILDGGLCDKGWWLPVAGYCHRGPGLKCFGGLIPIAVLLIFVKNCL